VEQEGDRAFISHSMETKCTQGTVQHEFQRDGFTKICPFEIFDGLLNKEFASTMHKVRVFPKLSDLTLRP